MSGRREVGARLLGPAGPVLLALAGGGLGLLAASRTWVHVVVADPFVTTRQVEAHGQAVAALVFPLGLVAMAGAVALLLGRSVGRRVVGLVLVSAGAASVATSIGVVHSPRTAVASAADPRSAATGRLLSTEVTGWPWLAVVAGALVVVAGVLAVVRAGRWAPRPTTSRYESPALPPDGPVTTGAEQPDAGIADPFVAWDALSRGDDPTGSAGDPDGSRAAP